MTARITVVNRDCHRSAIDHGEPAFAERYPHRS